MEDKMNKKVKNPKAWKTRHYIAVKEEAKTKKETYEKGMPVQVFDLMKAGFHKYRRKVGTGPTAKYYYEDMAILHGPKSGMGGFLNPPGHPAHTMSVALGRGRNAGSSSIDYAAKEESGLPPVVQRGAKRILSGWDKKKKPLTDPEVQDWARHVMGYFKGMYTKAGGSRNVTDLEHKPNLNPVENQDTHAGVLHIRDFYPDFKLEQGHVDEAYWGTKPEVKKGMKVQVIRLEKARKLKKAEGGQVTIPAHMATVHGKRVMVQQSRPFTAAGRHGDTKKKATTIREEGGKTNIKYHATDVVSFNSDELTLNSGGWLTSTTKKRINQASQEHDLGVSISQDKKKWYVTTKAGKFPFKDGMTINRTTGEPSGGEAPKEDISQRGNIYKKMLEAGIQIDSHESDLYVPVNEKTKAIVDAYAHKVNVKTFTHQTEKTPWYDIPFAYQPYWDKKPTGGTPHGVAW